MVHLVIHCFRAIHTIHFVHIQFSPFVILIFE